MLWCFFLFFSLEVVICLLVYTFILTIIHSPLYFPLLYFFPQTHFFLFLLALLLPIFIVSLTWKIENEEKDGGIHKAKIVIIMRLKGMDGVENYKKQYRMARRKDTIIYSQV